MKREIVYTDSTYKQILPPGRATNCVITVLDDDGQIMETIYGELHARKVPHDEQVVSVATGEHYPPIMG